MSDLYIWRTITLWTEIKKNYHQLNILNYWLCNYYTFSWTLGFRCGRIFTGWIILHLDDERSDLNYWRTEPHQTRVVFTFNHRSLRRLPLHLQSRLFFYNPVRIMKTNDRGLIYHLNKWFHRSMGDTINKQGSISMHKSNHFSRDPNLVFITDQNRESLSNIPHIFLI